MPALRGRTIVNLFYEASTRTSSSFELAAKRLSADVVSVRSAGSSVDKGESLKDTVQTLSAYDPAAIVIRSPHAGAAQLVAGWTSAAVDQRRRRQARAPDAGAARRVHAPPAARLARRRQHLDRRRRAALARRALEHPRVHADGRQGHGLRTADADPARDRGARVRGDGDARPAQARPTSCTSCGCSTSGCASRSYRRCASTPPRYQINARRLRPGQLLMHPGPVNRGVELSGDDDRLAPGADRRAGQGRGRGADGGPLRAARRLSDSGGGGVMSETSTCSGATLEPAELLIRGAHVLDPRSGHRRAARRAHPRTARSPSSAPPDSLPADERHDDDPGDRQARIPRLRRSRMSTCAPPGRSTRRTSRPAPPRRPPAGFCAVIAMPNTIPTVDDAAVLGSLVQRRQDRRARPGRVPRVDHPRPERRRADRDGRAARRRRARLHRRRQAGRARPGCCARRSSTSGCAAA